MVVEHVPGVVAEVIGGLNQPFYILHGLIEDAVEALVL